MMKSIPHITVLKRFLKKLATAVLCLTVFASVTLARPSCCAMLFDHCIPLGKSEQPFQSTALNCHTAPKDCSDVVAINPCAKKGDQPKGEDPSCCEPSTCEPKKNKDPFDRSAFPHADLWQGEGYYIPGQLEDDPPRRILKTSFTPFQTIQIYLLIQTLIC